MKTKRKPYIDPCGPWGVFENMQNGYLKFPKFAGETVKKKRYPRRVAGVWKV